ncbi:MAG TPA: hypothetical protein VFZ34_19520 [Blastocatellia bacterium]|nr:hypothetical protein [Blastocatellia bacterium]
MMKTAWQNDRHYLKLDFSTNQGAHFMLNPNQPKKPKSTEDILREMEEMSDNDTKAEASSSGGGALKSLLGFFVKVADDEEAPTPIKMPVSPPPATPPPPQAQRTRVGDLIANEPAPKIAPLPAPSASATKNFAEESFEDIYKAAGVPASQCSVDDLAKLLENPTIANQPMSVKVVAVNLTLSAKNLTAEEPITDALRRDRALDAYQAMLAERVVTTEQRNSAKIQQISQEVEEYLKRKQAEMDALKAEVAEAKKQSVEFAIRREIEEKRLADLITPFLEGKPNPVTVGNTPEV